MKHKTRHQEQLDASREALAEAGRDAIARGQETGTPVWVWRDSRWVDILAQPVRYTHEEAEPEEKPLTRVREEPER